MKNITIWAASAVIAVLGACTTEATVENGDGGSGSTTSGAAGSASTTSTTTTTTGTGGSGGSGGSSGDAATCVIGANPTACDMCAFSMCHDETCACDAVTDCKDARGAYFTCLSALDGGDMESCAGTFVTAAGATGAGKANDLATCMGDKCQDLCK